MDDQFVNDLEIPVQVHGTGPDAQIDASDLPRLMQSAYLAGQMAGIKNTIEDGGLNEEGRLIATARIHDAQLKLITLQARGTQH